MHTTVIVSSSTVPMSVDISTVAKYLVIQVTNGHAFESELDEKRQRKGGGWASCSHARGGR